MNPRTATASKTKLDKTETDFNGTTVHMGSQEDSAVYVVDQMPVLHMDHAGKGGGNDNGRLTPVVAFSGKTQSGLPGGGAGVSGSSGASMKKAGEHQPVTLSWDSIKVFVKDKKKKNGKSKVKEGEDVEDPAELGRGADDPPVKNDRKRIINNVSGVVQPGTLLAIMGASGAGKSTLMNILANRNLKEYKIEGDIKVNGLSVKDGIRNISAYVQQTDLFFSTLTVREILTFRANLHMDRKMTKKDRTQRIDDVMLEMGLTKCANTQVGSVFKRGISGGEAKRLSFACEMLTDPHLLFCDEPTSGLDSFMAQSIVQTLQEIAQKNRTILCTIHQPSSEVFAMFNKVLLLAEGRVAFMGESSEAMEYFRGLNYVCPVNYNPSDFYVLTLAIIPGKETECRKKVHAICDSFSNTREAGEIRQQITDLDTHAKENTAILEEAFNSGSRLEASWGIQFINLLWRSWISLMRDVLLFRVRTFQTLMIALLLGLIYFRMDYDQEGVMNINGALFILITNISFTNMFAVVNSFPHELAIFLREYGSGLYRTDVYFVAKNVSELPTFIILPLILICIDYWMMGLYDGWKNFLTMTAIIILVCNVCVSFGLLMSTVAGSVNVALAFAPTLMVPLMMFGGFFLNADSVPVYFIWLKYLSWFKYSNELLAVNQWKDVTSIECPSNTTVCPYKTGQDVLNYLNYSADNDELNIGLLFALLIGFRVIAYILLYIRARHSKA